MCNSCTNAQCIACAKKPIPNKHADVIKAWADGKEIEVFDTINNKWLALVHTHPMWLDTMYYRIKPKETVYYGTATCHGYIGIDWYSSTPISANNIKVTFNEDGTLKDICKI